MSPLVTESMKSLILRDLHLGSRDSLAEEVQHILEAEQFDRLILLGDIFADLDFSRLSSPQWELIGCIAGPSNRSPMGAPPYCLPS